MAKIDTLFMTKTAEKPYRLGPHIPIQPYKGVPPPPGKKGKNHNLFLFKTEMAKIDTLFMTKTA